MPYNPGYMPMGYMPQGYQQPEDRVIGVSGIDEVKAYPMPASSRFPFFSTTEDVCYIKSTDSNGAYTILTFEMTRREEPGEFVSRAEYDELKAMLQEVLDGKQLVPEQQ